MPDAALQKAIAAVGGNVSKLARLIGVKPQAIYQWERVPIDRVAAVEAATGVSRHELRPDIFGPAPGAAGVLGDGSTAERHAALGAGANRLTSEGHQLGDEVRKKDAAA